MTTRNSNLLLQYRGDQFRWWTYHFHDDSTVPSACILLAAHTIHPLYIPSNAIIAILIDRAPLRLSPVTPLYLEYLTRGFVLIFAYLLMLMQTICIIWNIIRYLCFRITQTKGKTEYKKVKDGHITMKDVEKNVRLFPNIFKTFPRFHQYFF